HDVLSPLSYTCQGSTVYFLSQIKLHHELLLGHLKSLQTLCIYLHDTCLGAKASGDFFFFFFFKLFDFSRVFYCYYNFLSFFSLYYTLQLSSFYFLSPIHFHHYFFLSHLKTLQTLFIFFFFFFFF